MSGARVLDLGDDLPVTMLSAALVPSPTWPYPRCRCSWVGHSAWCKTKDRRAEVLP